jgi:NADH-quinone oxidoreductase subunit J
MSQIFTFLIVVLISWFTIYVGTVRNIIYAVFSLIAVFFFSSILMLLLAQTDYLTFILVIVYIGAVVVFFLFVSMMVETNTEHEQLVGSKFLKFMLGVLISSSLIEYVSMNQIYGVCYSSEKAAILGIKESLNNIIPIKVMSNVNEIGNILYSHFAFTVILSGVILLVAIVGCVTISMETKKLSRLNQNTTDQILKSRILDEL